MNNLLKYQYLLLIISVFHLSVLNSKSPQSMINSTVPQPNKPDNLMKEPEQEEAASTTKIVVTNLPEDSFVAAGVLYHNDGKTNYAMQSPDENNQYTFHSNYYYAIAQKDRKDFKFQHKGTDFTWYTHWNAETDKITNQFLKHKPLHENWVGKNFTNKGIQNGKDITISPFDLRNYDLGGEELARIMIDDSTPMDQTTHFSGTKDQPTNLQNAILVLAIFNDMRMQYVNLTSAYMQFSKCLNTDFSNSNLQKAHLSCADFTGAQFINANLSNAYLGGYDPEIKFTGNTIFKNADFTGADLTGATYDQYTDFTNAKLTKAQKDSMIYQEAY